MGGFNKFELGDPPAETPAGLLETHVQTQQKLEVMLRYWEVWCLIIAQATGHAFCVRCMWLVDGFAGSGLHATNGHPDGAVAGTPSKPSALLSTLGVGTAALTSTCGPSTLTSRSPRSWSGGS